MLLIWFVWLDRLGPMGWPLMACSLLVLVIIFERTAFYLHAYTRRSQIWSEMSARMLQRQNQAKSVRDEALSLALADLQRPWYRSLKLLRFVGMLSPMLGLLGTILGIIQVFRVIAAHTGAISPGLIAGGLWEALLTTAVGLLIALPALLMAHIFQTIADG